MISVQKIKELIAGGEDFNVDFKRDVPSKIRELTEEVCAFANAAGGFVLIGVTDHNEIIGCKIENKKRSAIQLSIGEISPSLSCKLYSVEVDGKEVWVIEVPAGRDKPYFLAGTIYIREGANSQKVTSVDVIRNLFVSNNKLFFDAAPMPRVDLKTNLDEDNFNEFRREAGMSADIPVGQILENMQVFDEDGHAKRGGVLFFAKSPETYFFHAVIRCVRFKGIDKVYIIDDKTFGGPLVQQYHKAMAWLQSTLTVAYEITGIGPRREVWEIPLNVFKESIINALSHRDYFEMGASITIEVFDDRVEVTNPGGALPLVAQDFGRRSMSRNPLIFGLFNKMRLVEHIGSGIPRMRRDMAEAGLPEPVFETDGFFVVTFFRRGHHAITPYSQIPHASEADDWMRFAYTEPQKTKTTPTGIQHDIMHIMKQTPHATLPEIAAQVGLGRTSVYKIIKKMQEQGLVGRKGRKSDGIWVVLC
ncbi:MAG: putative DNA binding domain-containing protein [Bacteroidales bacterium]|nr:putative DNA binding domain-containing protein [Bacteroidales bacterium]